MGRLIEDVICIVILTIIPDFMLETFSIYDSMQAIINRRKNDGKIDWCG